MIHVNNSGFAGLGDARADLINSIKKLPGVGDFATKVVADLETVVEQAAQRRTIPIVVGGLVGMAIIGAVAVGVLSKK